MKILLVTPYFFEPHRWNIAAYKTAHSLARLGHDVVVFTSGSKGQPRTETPEPHLKVYRFRDIFIPDPANYGILPFLSFRLASGLHRERPTHSIVFTHMFYTSQAVGWLKLFRRKVVLITDTLVLPPLSVGEMTLRLYGALNYSQNSARGLRCAINGA